MAILRATLSQLVAGQRCINRWYYISEGTLSGVTSSFALARQLGEEDASGTGVIRSDTPLAALQAMQQSDVRFVSVLVEDLYVPSNFYELVYADNVRGDQGQQALSPFVAYGFRTNRVTRAIRRGYKRFSGVPETNVNSGGALTAAGLAEMQVLADRMSDNLVYAFGTSNVTFEPAILKFKPYETPSGKRAYEKFPTEAEQLANAARGVTWEPYNTTRSQVSRQRGRGD